MGGSRRNPQLSLTSTWFSHPPETPSASGQGPVALWYLPTRSLSSKMGSKAPENPNARPPLVVKTSPLEEDFLVGSSVLGAGINGKVVECTDRRSGNKCALKVIRDCVESRREVGFQNHRNHVLLLTDFG